MMRDNVVKHQVRRKQNDTWSRFHNNDCGTEPHGLANVRDEKWFSLPTTLRTDKDSRKPNPWHPAEVPKARNELAIWNTFYEFIFGAQSNRREETDGIASSSARGERVIDP